MSAYVLGISCYYHDSAAALTKEGLIVAAAQEERFSRKKHDSRFPKNATYTRIPRDVYQMSEKLFIMKNLFLHLNVF